jgi:hypothetical protein
MHYIFLFSFPFFSGLEKREDEKCEAEVLLEDEDLRRFMLYGNREIRVFHSISAVYGMSEHIILYDYSIA